MCAGKPCCVRGRRDFNHGSRGATRGSARVYGGIGAVRRASSPAPAPPASFETAAVLDTARRTCGAYVCGPRDFTQGSPAQRAEPLGCMGGSARVDGAARRRAGLHVELRARQARYRLPSHADPEIMHRPGPDRAEPAAAARARLRPIGRRTVGSDAPGRSMPPAIQIGRRILASRRACAGPPWPWFARAGASSSLSRPAPVEPSMPPAVPIGRRSLPEPARHLASLARKAAGVRGLRSGQIAY